MKRSIRWIITITLLLVVVVLLYYREVNKDEDKDEISVVLDKDKLLNKDLEENYPLTVCQVVQLFTRIQKCYYNEDCTNEELVRLAYMSTNIFDEELLANNPFDDYFSNLEAEINDFRRNKRTISRVIVGKAADVRYSTVDEVKYAALECIYYTQDTKGTSKNTTTYILRKDENDKWKILGWKEFVPGEWEE